MKRTPLSKTVRFEVFKRDKFSCQYCGRSAPDVILEVDHIVPVSKGGGNDLMNLITSCQDCNRGKTNRRLDDDTAIRKQKKQLDDLQERREQLEMMLKWRKALRDQIESEIDAISDIYWDYLEKKLTDTGRNIVHKQIVRFGFDEVYKATEYAILKYGDDVDVESIGGICFNRMRKRKEGKYDA